MQNCVFFDEKFKEREKLNFETFPMSLQQLKQIYHSNEMRFPEEICLRGKFRHIRRHRFLEAQLLPDP